MKSRYLLENICSQKQEVGKKELDLDGKVDYKEIDNKRFISS